MSSAEQILTLEPTEVAEPPKPAETQRIQGNYSPRPLARAGYLKWKYSFERVLGCLLIIPASPLILLLCACVKLTSKGPALYRQTRLGLKGDTYEIFKIRTMSINAEADGVARWCVKNDPRVTPLGRILRKLHLDEFPQLINVVRGEMVLVGPRPERPQIGAKLAEEIEDYYDRLLVKPGISGLAQINLPPDETLDDARRKQVLDLLYIEEAGFWLDLRMLVATALRILGIRGTRVMRAMGLCRSSKLIHLAPPVPASNLKAAIEEVSPTPAANYLARDVAHQPRDRRQSHDRRTAVPRRPR